MWPDDVLLLRSAAEYSTRFLHRIRWTLHACLLLLFCSSLLLLCLLLLCSSIMCSSHPIREIHHLLAASDHLPVYIRFGVLFCLPTRHMHSYLVANGLVTSQVVCDGWDPQTRTVYGEHFNYQLIGKQYFCKACRAKSSGKGKGKAGSHGARSNTGYKFAPWHPGVLKLLPRDLVELFPAVILRRSAVDKKLMTRVEQTLVSSMGLQTLADHVKENHLRHFLTLQLR